MIKRTHQRPALCPLHVGVSALCLLSTVPLPASAQVMEIDDAGGVTIHDRPEVTLATGATAIETPAAHQIGRPRVLDRDNLTDAASQVGLSADLVEAVAWRESGLRRGVVSPAGAIGEMQLMPGTARDLGVDPFDSRQNFSGGAVYLSTLLRRYDGDMMKALAAYNAGPKAVDRYGGVPPYKETEAYVAAILDRLSRRATASPER